MGLSLLNYDRKSFQALMTNGFGVLWSLTEPSPEEQLAVCKLWPGAFVYVLDPCEELQLYFVTKQRRFLGRFPNATDRVKLAALAAHGHAIQHIQNPTEEMKRVAVQQAGNAIKWINNPSEELMLLAVKEKATSFQWIKHPTPEVCKIAIRADPRLLRWVNDRKKPYPLSHEDLLMAIQDVAYIIMYVPTRLITKELRLAAIKKNAWTVDKIRGPLRPDELALAVSMGYTGPRAGPIRKSSSLRKRNDA